MKARLPGRCPVCIESIKPGEEIEKLLGRWTHAACKAEEMARRVEAAGGVSILPTVHTAEGPEGPIGVKLKNRRKFRRKNGNRP